MTLGRKQRTNPGSHLLLIPSRSFSARCFRITSGGSSETGTDFSTFRASACTSSSHPGPLPGKVSRMYPSRSTIHVYGRAVIFSCLPAKSTGKEYSRLKSNRNCCMSSTSRSTFRLMNVTEELCRIRSDSRCNAGNSSIQGPHHAAHRATMTTCPLDRVRSTGDREGRSRQMDQ